MAEMKKKSKAVCDRIGLISTPWPLFNRPSIQLGTLKAFLQTRVSDLQVDAFHFYLSLAQSIGYRVYQEISERTWLAESVYAALLYPGRSKQAEALFRRESSGNAVLRSVKFKTLSTRVKKATEAFLDRHDWKEYGLLGFTTSLCQLTSTLYVVKRIKNRFPDLVIVVGGPSTSGPAARGLLEHFPEIDIVVNGEGEKPLFQIVKQLRSNPLAGDLSKIKGVITRGTIQNQVTDDPVSQIERLDRLPAPDYDDYFNLLKTFSAQQTFFPTLPVEISRGCWWKGASVSVKTGGCAFCNLNLQWNGYRSKSADQVVSEIDYLTRRHRLLTLAIMDNVLPKKDTIEIFARIGKLKKNLRLFAEVRATTPWKELKALHDSGMQQVQVGIEALSSSLLKKLHKGTTAIQNLEIMKNCEALGMQNISNLVIQFPGSNESDVAETLNVLEFAWPFYPLKAVAFWLGLESPVWRNPKKYGIKAVFNHPNWSRLFPQEVGRSLPFMIQAYRGDVTFQRRIWKPVKNKISMWQKMYSEIHRRPGHLPILSFRDGRDFMIIRQGRYQTEPLTHRLVGVSRSIYLFCQRHRSFKAILSAFPNMPDDKIQKFLNMMVDKKLMFQEQHKYLSLAVPVK